MSSKSIMGEQDNLNKTKTKTYHRGLRGVKILNKLFSPRKACITLLKKSGQRKARHHLVR